MEPLATTIAPSSSIRNMPSHTINRGNAKDDKGDSEGAIVDYTRAIELNPKYAAAYYNLAYTKQAKGDIDGAIADYTRAIELNPKDAVAYNDRGVTRQQKYDFHGAIADFDHAIKLNPKYAAAYANRGNAEQRMTTWMAQLLILTAPSSSTQKMQSRIISVPTPNGKRRTPPVLMPIIAGNRTRWERWRFL